MIRNVLLILPFFLSGIWQATHATYDYYDPKTKTVFHYKNGDWTDKDWRFCTWRCGWFESTWNLYEKMREIGFDDPLAVRIINECKTHAKDPRHCIITASFIATAESSAGQNLTECKNVFGITGGCYATRTEAVKVWVQKYVKFWFRRPDPSHFYSDTPKRKPQSYYCLSENSSGAQGYCPFGYKHAWSAFNTLTK